VLQRSRRRKALTALSVIALVAVAACGDDDDNSSSATTTPGTVATGSTPTSDTAEETTAASSESSETTTGETTESTEGTTRVTTAGELTAEDPPNPVQGGTLVYGLEADTANAWAPYRASYATSGYVPLSAVSDSLFAVTDAGETVPLLVESVEHNADYTQWTMHIRDGIKFQDGTVLDGAAVKFNIDSTRASPLSGAALATIDHIEATGQDVTIFTKGGPWVALPGYFGYGALGYMMSPKWLASLPDVPQRVQGSPVYDAALAATPADGDPARPVGLGAFTFDSYTPGNGNSFKAKRNPDYWRGPKGITGEKLPYLDEIDAVVAVDEDSRSNSTRAGDFDIMMTSMGDTIKQAIDDGTLEINSSSRYGETQYLLLNVAAGDTDPEGKNASSPLLNLDCRKALAYAIDRDRWAKERGGGLQSPANGPFPPGSVGYLEDNGYPEFDIAKAQAEMDVCLQALGTDHIDFTFNTTNDPFNVESNSLIVSMWQDAFGDKVTTKITPIEQGQYIGLALTGTFNAFGWRNHGGLDPDQQRLWWASASAAPIGSLALNFGRFKDPEMDKQLDIIKSNPDPAARKAAAEEVNRIFGKQVYNWWQAWALWGIISQPYVNGVQANVLPDGTKGIGLAFAGRHQLNEMWCDGGKCE
jgi:peptide/nickel transport system substrate-binding protein